jgi:hypothetical protein
MVTQSAAWRSDPQSCNGRKLGERAGWPLFIVAVLILVIAGARDIAAPWENGMRGGAAASYTDGAVAHTLRYGIGVTLGLPTFVVEVDGGLDKRVNWHHPPLYWLLASGAAWLFGHHTWVLRAFQLLLFLPGLFGLFWLLRLRSGALPAGLACVLFASCPLVAYYGPMALQDGAVLAWGLLTIASFQALLERPGLRPWLRTAALFFFVTSLDYPGYWWGLAMFVLAATTAPRWRSVATAISFFPVSLLSFTATAVHYGLVLGGPWAYIREVFHVVGADHDDARATVTWDRIENAIRDVLITHGNWPVLALAVIGIVLATLSRRPEVRRCASAALALTIPGVINYGAMFVHAVGHVFWSMHGFGGVCVFAAVAPIVGIQSWAEGAGRGRVLGAVLLAASLAVVAWGAHRTHLLVGSNAFVDNGTPATMARAIPHMDSCAWSMTSAPRCPQQFFGHTQTWGGIDTAEKLRIALELGGKAALRGKFAFVVDPRHRDAGLLALLDSLGSRVDADEVLVYHIKL